MPDPGPITEQFFAGLALIALGFVLGCIACTLFRKRNRET